jgi:VWFA-related protein
MVRPIHVFTCAALGLLTAGGGLAAWDQTTTSEPRALTVDVWVRDLQGQPVSTLSPGDFVVQVAGQQRRVTAARFVDYAAADAPAAPPSAPSSFTSLPGRTIALVVDDLSFTGEEAAPLGDAAARWVEQLYPSDRVAIVRATATRGRVAAADQADAASRVREATAAAGSGPAAEADAEFLLERRTLEQVEAIARSIAWLASQPGPRVLVVLSRGIAMLPAATRYLSTSFRVARDAGIGVYLVTPDAANPSASKPSPASGWNSVPADGPRLPGAGLDQIAAGTGGRVLRAQTGGDGFAGIQRAVSGFYRLDVDAPSAGPLPRSLPVMVSVRPAGLAVGAGALVMPPAGMSAPRTTADRTRDILAGVDVAGDIDFDATASLARDASSADQLLLTVSLVLPQALTSPVRVEFGLLDETGTLRFGTIDVPDVADGDRRTSVSIAVAPGWHRLTLVAEDGQAHLGSLARAVHARLRSIGGYSVADPRLLWRAEGGADSWQMLGGDTLPEDAVVAASVFELYPDAPGRQPPPLPLRLEDETGREVATQMLTPTSAGQGWRLLSEVRLDGLAPGGYVFTLDTRLLDDAAGPLSLRFRKTTAAAAESLAGRPAPPPLPNVADLLNLFRAGVRDNWPRYAPEDLLAPDLLMPQLKALAGSRALPAALVNATGDAWWTSLRTLTKQPGAVGLAARGLTALRDGDARAAESHLREVVAASPTSTASRRLLGVAFAASGRDDAAAGVWSLAMNERTVDPRWTLAFAEALGRTGDYRASLDMLRRIPGEPSGRHALRTVEALMVIGLMDEAMAALVAWESGEGREQPAGRQMFYLVALRYAAALQLSADARAIDDFRRAADRYVTAGGEYADMVAPWIQSTAALEAR